MSRMEKCLLASMLVSLAAIAWAGTAAVWSRQVHGRTVELADNGLRLRVLAVDIYPRYPFFVYVCDSCPLNDAAWHVQHPGYEHQHMYRLADGSEVHCQSPPMNCYIYVNKGRLLYE